MSIEEFFAVESIAVVGASRQQGKVGRAIVANLVRDGFPGKIYPVNPHAGEIEGLPCWPSVEAIDPRPDLVLIVVPAPGVSELVARCGRLGVKQVIVVSAGFREAGPAGAALEEELLGVVRGARMRMIGPNCLGVLCPSRRMNASFAGGLPRAGSVGYFSQSGAVMTATLDIAQEMGIGFSKLISLGNSSDVTELDVLKAFAHDEETRVIAGYLEAIGDADGFFRQAERIARDKPILLIKSGQTDAGAVAASWHTGRVTGIQQTYERVFEQAGIIRCESIADQLNYALAMSGQPLPAGPGVAVVTNGGGTGIMAVDAMERQGLRVVQLEEDTLAALRAALPASAGAQNPVNILGDALADRYEKALGIVLRDAGVHSVMVVLTPHSMTQCHATAEAIVRAVKTSPGKSVHACFIGGAQVHESLAVLRAAGIPGYESPVSAVGGIRAMVEYARWRERPRRVVRLFPVNRRKVEKIIHRAIRAGKGQIGETETRDILEAYGFVTPRAYVATSGQQAVGFAEQMGYPVTLSVWSAEIPHTAQIGGARVPLTSEQAILDGFDLIMYRASRLYPEARILGVRVQETCKRGREVVLGMNRDVHFGPLMTVGTGGSLEVLREAAFYLAPLTCEEAKDMLLRTRTYDLLTGGPDRPGVDIDAIAEGLQRLSQLATEFPQIEEVDINPYVVGEAGTTPVAVDAHLRVTKD